MDQNVSKGVTRCFVGGRGTGKTAFLVNVSSQTGARIVVPTREQAREAVFLSQRMGTPIKAPATPYEFAAKFTALERSVIVDEAQAVLEHFLAADIMAMTVNGFPVLPKG